MPGTLQGVGVSIARLLDIYNRLYTAKDSVWLTSGDELHILKVSFLLRISSSRKISRIRFSRHFFRTLPQLQAKFPQRRGDSSQLYARSLSEFSCSPFSLWIFIFDFVEIQDAVSTYLGELYMRQTQETTAMVSTFRFGIRSLETATLFFCAGTSKPSWSGFQVRRTNVTLNVQMRFECL